MKHILKTALAVSLAIPALSFAKTVNKGRALIEMMGHHQVTITKTFKGPEGLTGYVVVPKGTKKGTIVFTNAAGSYLFAGNIFNSKGQNLTQKFNQQYVLAPIAKEAHADVTHMGWFTEGKNSAPHKAYIVLDANCIYCHMLYDRIQPEIASGKLQVRWVPVGVIKPSSKGKAAQILYAKGDKARVKLLRQDETAFKLKIEEGGISPLKMNKKDKAVTAAFKAVEHNNTLFTKYQFQGTPVVIYLNHQGKPQAYPGYPQGRALQALLADMSNKW